MLDAAGAYMENGYELAVGKSGGDLDAKLGKPTVRLIVRKHRKHCDNCYLGSHSL